MIAIWDFWRTQRKRPRDADSPERTVYSAGFRLFMQGSTRYLMPALLLSWSGVLTAAIISIPRSTYVCPAFPPHNVNVPIFQWLGLFLDCFILASIAELVGKPDAGSRRWSKGALVLGNILLVSNRRLHFSGELQKFERQLTKCVPHIITILKRMPWPKRLDKYGEVSPRYRFCGSSFINTVVRPIVRRTIAVSFPEYQYYCL